MLALRYLGIPFAEHEIPGLCVSAESREEALSFFEMVRDYFELKGPKNDLSVECVPDAHQTYSVEFRFDERIGNVHIHEVDAGIVDSVVLGLRTFRNFLIISGYQEGDHWEFLDPPNFHLWKREIFLNHELVSGKDMIRVDWTNLVANIFDQE